MFSRWALYEDRDWPRDRQIWLGVRHHIMPAAHAVLNAAGGSLLGPDGEELDYDLVEDILNPWFLATTGRKWVVSGSSARFSASNSLAVPDSFLVVNS